MAQKKPNSTSLADPVLLSKIDKLFACGVGEYVALPQLICVGDQSSGKSSVLEGLTNLPFPRDSGLCTRFATQITFRRAQDINVSVSIFPARDATTEHAEIVKAWSKPNLTLLEPDAFRAIMKEVHTVMGLSEGKSEDERPTFSEDVLRLEISGPEQEHFSVVDVPGIFRNVTKGVTKKGDQEMVKAMVRRYMENPRSVILTVIPCNVDLATQEILTMAEEVDEEGQRTLGVLTKPDLTDIGTEPKVIDLVEGRRHKLTLGWCLVRNPGQQQLEDPSTDRYALEKNFFRSKEPWNTIDKDKVGVEALRARLQVILATHIRHEFPKVKSEILKKLAVAKQQRTNLGEKRQTTEEQTRYLLNISMQFQEITRLALSANYVSSNWFDQDRSLKLATAVTMRSELFSNDLEQFGQSYHFEGTEDAQPIALLTRKQALAAINGLPFEDQEIQQQPERQESEKQDSAVPEPDADEEISLRTTENHLDLDDLMFEQSSISKAVGCNIMAWLTNFYRTSRGFELGTFDSSLLAMTMKDQSSKWVAIALTYISDIVSLTHSFIINLLTRVCPERRVREGLISLLMESLIPMYKAAFDNARFLLYVERMGTPITQNHYFSDELQKSREFRRLAQLKKHTWKDADRGEVIRLTHVVKKNNMSNTEHTVREVHDILKAYYKVARKRFVDNMCMQAADYRLVTGPETPLKLFSPKFVIGLSAEQLGEIAGEDGGLIRRRGILSKEIKDLEAGKIILT